MAAHSPQPEAVTPVQWMVGRRFKLCRSTSPWRALVIAGELGGGLDLKAASVTMTASDGSGGSAFNGVGTGITATNIPIDPTKPVVFYRLILP